MTRREHVDLNYPESRRVDQVDDYHGHPVADPYRWLEDMDSDETRSWIAAQNEITEQFLDRVPGRSEILQRVTELWNFERFGVPIREGGRYFYFRNSGLENQAVLYTMEQLDGEPRVLLDPNTMSVDGTLALVAYAPSRDGRFLAYSVSTSGSDWQHILVRDVAGGADLEDRLDWVKFSDISWTADHEGFFYSCYDAPSGDEFAGENYFQKLYYHQLGTSQSADRLVYDNPDEQEWGFLGHVTEDGRYLVIHIRKGSGPKHCVYFKDLDESDAMDDCGIVKLMDGFDARYEFVGNARDEFWFLTDRDAPRARLVGVDLGRSDPSQWREIIPEGDATLEAVVAAGEGFVARFLEHARSRVELYGRDGGHVRELELPGIGSVVGFFGKAGGTEAFYAFTDFTSAPTIYRYDVATGKNEVFRSPQIDVVGSRFETRQVFYQSSDGTTVPMFLVHRTDLELDGNNPTLLYGYGGFNISMTPAFSVRNLAWLEMGGVYAVANIRGGGEYGEEWHQAGIRRNKQNGIDDFIAAAEWLTSNRYTSPNRLAIHGGSNGGMLVGACMTQRPDLFAAVVSAVGVMDLLRFDKFTIGWAWRSDYGSPDDPDDFNILRACSPYHNLREGTEYPATMITTGDHDDRVVPCHSFKFAAALQSAQAARSAAVIRIGVSAGHGMGKPTSMQIEEAADVLTFLKHSVM